MHRWIPTTLECKISPICTVVSREIVHANFGCVIILQIVPKLTGRVRDVRCLKIPVGSPIRLILDDGNEEILKDQSPVIGIIYTSRSIEIRCLECNLDTLGWDVFWRRERVGSCHQSVFLDFSFGSMNEVKNVVNEQTKKKHDDTHWKYAS